MTKSSADIFTSSSAIESAFLPRPESAAAATVSDAMNRAPEMLLTAKAAMPAAKASSIFTEGLRRYIKPLPPAQSKSPFIYATFLFLLSFTVSTISFTEPAFAKSPPSRAASSRISVRRSEESSMSLRSESSPAAGP